MKLFVVDDNVLYRQSLVSILDQQPDIEVVGEAGTVDEAVEKALALAADLVLMDILLADGSGLEAMKRIQAEKPQIKIVVLTLYEGDDLLFNAIRCGAKGYLIKNMQVPKLLSALRGLERGEAALSRSMTGRLLDEFTRQGLMNEPSVMGMKSLTSREMEVLEHLGRGATNRQIGDRLFIAENTVKIHVRKILSKLRLNNRHEAGRFARRIGLINSHDNNPVG